MPIPTKYLLPHIKTLAYNNILIINKIREEYPCGYSSYFSDSHGARTHDPNIKSVVLYQLS